MSIRADLFLVFTAAVAVPAGLRAQTIRPIEPKVAWTYDTGG